MRVSQRQMFTQYLGNMNNSLSALMESNEQSSSQKRINRPSDDPAGMARVMMYRESLSNIERNKANISEATGWLNLADHALMGVSDIITKIKALNLQSATGTQSGDNREQNATQVRAYFEELINWANEKYNGQHIFAGHKVEQPAYGKRLGVTCDAAVEIPPAVPGDPPTSVAFSDMVNMIASGDESFSTLIQFTGDGTLGDVPPPAYVYSSDGGKTWSSPVQDWTTDAQGNPMLNAGGTTISFVMKDPYIANDLRLEAVPTAPEPSEKESEGGTWLTVRPTAVYLGDDHDTQVIQPFGASLTGNIVAEGSFSRDVSVRIVHPATFPSTDPIKYEYSLDGGSNWVPASAPADSKQLAIPGGHIRLDNAADSFEAGQEFLVHPRRADIDFEISSNQTVTVNMVGKEVFGGIYQEPFTDYPTVVGGPNLFETLGKLVGYCETNNQNGIQACLEELNDCQKYIGVHLANVGGRENRVAVAFETASIRELSETGAMSAIEDVDVVTLMTRLAQQQLAYNTVLKSSSMIMQMSLMNFI